MLLPACFILQHLSAVFATSRRLLTRKRASFWVRYGWLRCVLGVKNVFLSCSPCDHEIAGFQGMLDISGILFLTSCSGKVQISRVVLAAKSVFVVDGLDASL